MDLEEWELLPGNDGFVDIGRKYGLSQHPPEEINQLTSPVRQSRVVPSPSSWEPVIDGEKETTEKTDKEPVPEVFPSMKLEENTKSVDMKMDLPRSDSRVTSGNSTHIDESFIELDESIKTKKDDKDGTESWYETVQDPAPELFSPKKMEEKVESVDMKMDLQSGSFMELDETMESKKIGDDQSEMMEENEVKPKIWKAGLTGVGAICSFGVAAVATIGVIFLGNNHKNLMNHDNNQKIRFQIFSNNKVAARGVPITRAHISYGGYYNHL